TPPVRAIVLLTYSHRNRQPVASFPTLRSSDLTSLTVNAPGVLVNDTDADGDPLTAILVTGTTHGALNLLTNGSFTYTPASNYFRSEEHTYRPQSRQPNAGRPMLNMTDSNINRA